VVVPPNKPNTTVVPERTETIIEKPRTQRTTTVVAAPVRTARDEKARFKALEDSLGALRLEQQRLSEELKRSQADTARTTVRTDTVMISRTDTTGKGKLQAELVRSWTYRQHAELMNRMLMDRITLMELYLNQQEQQAPDSTLEDLRQQVLTLDARVDSLRAVQRMQGTDTKPNTGPTGKVSVRDSSSKSMERFASTDTLYFRSGSIQVAPAYQQRIKEIAAERARMGKGNIIVTGHTDRSGKATFNLMLSQQRAEAVARALEAAGVPRSAIKAARAVHLQRKGAERGDPDGGGALSGSAQALASSVSSSSWAEAPSHSSITVAIRFARSPRCW
jgi:outer membrane protein OmpA-like peptidoglycan-associated protein